MTALLWVAIAVLGLLVLWLGLALAGVVREQAVLRERVDALEGAPVRLGSGLPLGAPAPAWEVRTPEGDLRTSSAFAGTRHVVLFADADCAACDEVVPDVVTAAAAGALPPVAVIGRGDPEATPAAWRSPDPRVIVGAERADDATSSYQVETSPHAFVVDESGFVVARGGAASVEDVRALVRGADGIRIVPGGDGG
ncbi:MAG: TlpA family protein disulfide reductase [Planctomycetaceae bacterium]